MTAITFSFTLRGDALNNKICELFDDTAAFGKSDSFLKYTNIHSTVKKYFKKGNVLIFIGSAGIAVRVCAPFIKDKSEDPALIVIDEYGRFVIPLLSGHIGGANETAAFIAERINAAVVITTATDINGIWAADTWAAKNQYTIVNKECIKHISSALLDGSCIGIASDFEWAPPLPSGVKIGAGFKNGIVISYSQNKKIYENNLNIVPKSVVIGVGSKKDVSENALIHLWEAVSTDYNISNSAVKAVATIELKKNEAAVKRLAEYIGCKIMIFSAEELGKAVGCFVSSEFVKQITGIGNVCERAAVCGAGGGRLLVNKTLGSGVTLAAASEKILLKFI